MPAWHYEANSYAHLIVGNWKKVFATSEKCRRKNGLLAMGVSFTFLASFGDKTEENHATDQKNSKDGRNR